MSHTSTLAASGHLGLWSASASSNLVASLRDHISNLIHGPDNPLSCQSPVSSPHLPATTPAATPGPSSTPGDATLHAPPTPSSSHVRERTSSHSSLHLPTTPHLRRTSSIPICAHSPETRAALAAIYDQLLDLVEVIHPHIFTDVITPLGSPMIAPNDAETTATKTNSTIGGNKKMGDTPPASRDVTALMATVKDQRRLVNKSMLDLQVEKGLNKVLRSENQALKEKLVQIAAATEQEEEALTNKFLVRIEELHKEKARIIEQVEREEEYITNQLQRKLAKLQREKIDMENQLEMEQEAIVNRLQKQLEMLRSSTASSSQQGSQSQLDVPSSPTSATEGSFPHRRRTSSTHSSLHDVTLPPPPSLVDVMRADIAGLKQRIHELERENENRVQQLRTWRDELLVLRQRAGVPVDDLFTEPLEPLAANRTSRHGSRSASQSRMPIG